MSDIVVVLLLITSAFLLGSCPFSVWIGSLRLHKVICKRNDRSVGAANVFKVGGWWRVMVAMIADIIKGITFVAAAKGVIYLPQPVTFLVAAAYRGLLTGDWPHQYAGAY